MRRAAPRRVRFDRHVRTIGFRLRPPHSVVVEDDQSLAGLRCDDATFNRFEHLGTTSGGWRDFGKRDRRRGSRTAAPGGSHRQDQDRQRADELSLSTIETGAAPVWTHGGPPSLRGRRLMRRDTEYLASHPSRTPCLAAFFDQ